MASNVRFVDNLKVGAYSAASSGGGGGGITILNNVNNYVLTATGGGDTIKGNPQLIFDGTAAADFEINDISIFYRMKTKNSNNTILTITYVIIIIFCTYCM